MNSYIKKALSLLVTISTVCFTVPSNLSTMAQAAEKSKNGSACISQADTVPSGLQADLTFPDWAGYVDDTLLMNNIYSFRSYRGQGELYIKCTGLQSASAFINGQSINISQACKNNGKTYKIDISSLTKNGTNTIQINDYNPSDGKINVKIPYPTVINGTAASVNVDQDKLDFIDAVINNDIKYGFSSAQLAIVKDGVMIKNTAYGTINSYHQDGTKKPNSPRVMENTLYDLASNTKMYATNYALQKLVYEGKINVNDKVIKYLPEFKDEANDSVKGKADLTLKEVMEHQAGFPADPQYFNDHYNQVTQKADPNVKNELFSQDKDTTIQMIMKTPLQYQPGTKTVYSDVDYMLLGIIVEKITGEPLDQYVENTIYKPIGLNHIVFNPLKKGFRVDDCAATEIDGNVFGGTLDFLNVRTKTIEGEVHDAKAYYCMGGVSGHAGLFASAGDLAKLCQVMLNGGGYGGNKFFDQDTIDEFTKRKDSLPTWCLGWWREGDHGRPWYFGVESSDNTIGHQGWTGTLTMIDPASNLVIVLLTNKINTPLIDPKSAPTDFLGNKFTTATLGTIPELVYQAIEHTGKVAMDADAIEMVDEKLKLYREEAQKYDGKAVLQATYPLVDTIINRAAREKSNYALANAKKAVTELPHEADQSIVSQFSKRLDALATYKSDTTNNLSVKTSYTFKITSKNGEAPSLLFGTSGVFKCRLIQKSSNDYYFKITAVGPAGSSTGIYINGDTRLLVATVEKK